MLNLPFYIALIAENLEENIIRCWYNTVKNNAPSGIIFSTIVNNEDDTPTSVEMIERKTDHTRYIISLIRALNSTESERIAIAFAEAQPDIDFIIETCEFTSTPEPQKLINLGNENLITLCMLWAKQKHDKWLKARLDNGWKYGVEFSFYNKTHPLLISWEQLSDKDKELDLSQPQDLINVLTDFGYSVISNDDLQKLKNIISSFQTQA